MSFLPRDLLAKVDGPAYDERQRTRRADVDVQMKRLEDAYFTPVDAAQPSFEPAPRQPETSGFRLPSFDEMRQGAGVNWGGAPTISDMIGQVGSAAQSFGSSFLRPDGTIKSFEEMRQGGQPKAFDQGQAWPDSVGIQAAPAGDTETMVVEEARRLGIDPELALRVMRQESGGNPDAVSPAGARGLFQVMPATEAEVRRKYGITEEGPAGNVRVGLSYLREQLDRYGDVSRALAAYNAGPGSVELHGGVPPFAETQAYVERITNGYAGTGRGDRGAVPGGGGSPGVGGDLTPDQFDPALSEEEALAACGPAAAVAFARVHGRNPTMREAVELAKQVGWTTAQGMAGPASQVDLLKSMGVEAALQPDVTEDAIDAQLQAGRPVIVSTAGHYFVVSGRTTSGKYIVGQSGKVYRGGADVMSLDEITRLGGGANGLIVMSDQGGASSSPPGPFAGGEAPSSPPASPGLSLDVSGPQRVSQGLGDLARQVAPGAQDLSRQMAEGAQDLARQTGDFLKAAFSTKEQPWERGKTKEQLAQEAEERKARYQNLSLRDAQEAAQKSVDSWLDEQERLPDDERSPIARFYIGQRSSLRAADTERAQRLAEETSPSRWRKGSQIESDARPDEPGGLPEQTGAGFVTGGLEQLKSLMVSQAMEARRNGSPGEALAFERMASWFSDKVSEHPEWQRPKNMPTTDWRWESWGRVFGEGLPSILTALGAAVMTGLAVRAGGGSAGLATAGEALAGWEVSRRSEGAQAYEDAIKAGLREGDAQVRADIVGNINAAIEQIPLFGWVKSLPGGKAWVEQIEKRVVSHVLAEAMSEGTEESLQEMVQNAVAMTYDRERGLFDNVVESFLGGAIPGGAMAAGRRALAGQPKTAPEFAELLRNNLELLAQPQPGQASVDVALAGLPSMVARARGEQPDMFGGGEPDDAAGGRAPQPSKGNEPPGLFGDQDADLGKTRDLYAEYDRKGGRWKILERQADGTIDELRSGFKAPTNREEADETVAELKRQSALKDDGFDRTQKVATEDGQRLMNIVREAGGDIAGKDLEAAFSALPHIRAMGRKGATEAFEAARADAMRSGALVRDLQTNKDDTHYRLATLQKAAPSQEAKPPTTAESLTDDEHAVLTLLKEDGDANGNLSEPQLRESAYRRGILKGDALWNAVTSLYERGLLSRAMQITDSSEQSMGFGPTKKGRAALMARGLGLTKGEAPAEPPKVAQPGSALEQANVTLEQLAEMTERLGDMDSRRMGGHDSDLKGDMLAAAWDLEKLGSYEGGAYRERIRLAARWLREAAQSRPPNHKAVSDAWRVVADLVVHERDRQARAKPADELPPPPQASESPAPELPAPDPVTREQEGVRLGRISSRVGNIFVESKTLAASDAAIDAAIDELEAATKNLQHHEASAFDGAFRALEEARVQPTLMDRFKPLRRASDIIGEAVSERADAASASEADQRILDFLGGRDRGTVSVVTRGVGYAADGREVRRALDRLVDAGRLVFLGGKGNNRAYRLADREVPEQDALPASEPAPTDDRAEPEAAPVPPAPPEQPPSPAAPDEPEPDRAGTYAFGLSDPTRRYQLRYEIRDLDDLIPSHTDDLKPNPAYPDALQPRDRSSAASQLQVASMAQKLDPGQLLDETHALDRGAPIIGDDNLVESGNGRVLALRRARDTDAAGAYRAALEQRAADLGLSEQLAGKRFPVLARVRVTEVEDRQAFANEANGRATAAMRESEQARQDARLLTDDLLARLTPHPGESLERSLNHDDNIAVIRDQFLRKLPAAEQAGLVTSDGLLSREGLARFRNALFARVYTGDIGRGISETFMESLDDEGLANARTAIFNSLPAVARMQGLIREGQIGTAYDPADDLATALDAWYRLRYPSDGKPRDVLAYASQADLFGNTPMTSAQSNWLTMFELLRRAPRQMRELIEEYTQRVEQTVPPPNQATMFDLPAQASKEEILASLIRRLPGAPSAGPTAAQTEGRDQLARPEEGRLDPAADRGASVRGAGPEPAAGPAAEPAGQPGDQPVPEQPAGQRDHPGNAPERPVPEDSAAGGAGGSGERGPDRGPRRELPGAGGGPTGGQLRGQRLVTARPEHTVEVDTAWLPASITRDTHGRDFLAPHQRQGVAKMIVALRDVGGFLLGDGTGVGKTRQLLAVAKHHAEQGDAVFIMAPKQVLNPEEEGGRWVNPTGSYQDDADALGLQIRYWDGGPLEPGKVYVTHYDRAKGTRAKAGVRLPANAIVVWDEAHRIKNFDSGLAKMAGRLNKQAKGVIYASATPQDKPTHLPYMYRAGLLEGDGSLARAMSKLGLDGKKKTEKDDEGNDVDIWEWQLSRGFTVDDVLQRYDGLFNRLTERGLMLKRDISFEGYDVQVAMIEPPDEATAMLRLLQAEFAGKTDPKNLIGQQRRALEPHKAAWIARKVKEELDAGRQVVVFIELLNDTEHRINETIGFDAAGEPIKAWRHIAWSEGTLRVLRRELGKLGITRRQIAEMRGAIKDREGKTAEPATSKAAEIARFNSGESPVMIATAGAGGVGINLDAREAPNNSGRPRTMIVATSPWAADQNIQVLGRIWRLPTVGDARAYYVLTATASDTHGQTVLLSKMRTLGVTIRGEIDRVATMDLDLPSADTEIAKTRSPEERHGLRYGHGILDALAHPDPRKHRNGILSWGQLKIHAGYEAGEDGNRQYRRDLDAVLRAGYVESRRVAGRGGPFTAYTLSETGKARAGELDALLAPKAITEGDLRAIPDAFWQKAGRSGATLDMLHRELGVESYDQEAQVGRAIKALEETGELAWVWVREQGNRLFRNVFAQAAPPAAPPAATQTSAAPVAEPPVASEPTTAPVAVSAPPAPSRAPSTGATAPSKTPPAPPPRQTPVTTQAPTAGQTQGAAPATPPPPAPPAAPPVPPAPPPSPPADNGAAPPPPPPSSPTPPVSEGPEGPTPPQPSDDDVVNIVGFGHQVGMDPASVAFFQDMADRLNRRDLEPATREAIAADAARLGVKITTVTAKWLNDPTHQFAAEVAVLHAAASEALRVLADARSVIIQEQMRDPSWAPTTEEEERIYQAVAYLAGYTNLLETNLPLLDILKARRNMARGWGLAGRQMQWNARAREARLMIRALEASASIASDADAALGKLENGRPMTAAEEDALRRALRMVEQERGKDPLLTDDSERMRKTLGDLHDIEQDNARVAEREGGTGTGTGSGSGDGTGTGSSKSGGRRRKADGEPRERQKTPRQLERERITERAHRIGELANRINTEIGDRIQNDGLEAIEADLSAERAELDALLDEVRREAEGQPDEGPRTPTEVQKILDEIDALDEADEQGRQEQLEKLVVAIKKHADLKLGRKLQADARKAANQRPKTARRFFEELERAIGVAILGGKLDRDTAPREPRARAEWLAARLAVLNRELYRLEVRIQEAGKPPKVGRLPDLPERPVWAGSDGWSGIRRVRFDNNQVAALEREREWTLGELQRAATQLERDRAAQRRTTGLRAESMREATEAVATGTGAEILAGARKRARREMEERRRFRDGFGADLQEAVDRALLDDAVASLKAILDASQDFRSSPEYLEHIRSSRQRLQQFGTVGEARARAIRERIWQAGIRKQMLAASDEEQTVAMLLVSEIGRPNPDGSQPSDEEAERRLMNLIRYMRGVDAVTFLNTLAVVNLVSSPLTWGLTGINFLSNTLRAVGRLAWANPMEVLLDALAVGASRMVGRRRERTAFWSELGAAQQAFLMALPEAASLGWEIMRRGRSTAHTRIALETADLGRVQREALTERLGWVGALMHAFSTRPLEAADAFWGHLLHASNLNLLIRRRAEQIHRQESAAGQRTAASITSMSGKPLRVAARPRSVTDIETDIRRSPWDHMDLWQEAGKRSDYSLYRSRVSEKGSALDRVMAALAKARYARPNAPLHDRLLAALLHSQFPFIVTPYNWIKANVGESLLYTMTGWADLGRKDLTREQKLEVATKMLTGAAVATIGWFLASIGSLEGDGPPDEEERAMLPSNWQRNSFHVYDRASDRHSYLSYDGSPWAVQLAAMANTRDLLSYLARRGRLNPDNAPSLVHAVASAYLLGTMRTITQQSMLRSVDTLINTLTDPRRRPDYFVSGLAQRVVPLGGLLAFLARMGDPVQRDPENWMEMIQNRVPGLRNQLPEKIDRFGRTIENTQSGPMALAPFRPSSMEDSDLRQFLADYDMAMPEAPKRWGGRELNGFESRRFQTMSAVNVRQALQGLRMSTDFMTASPDARQRMIRAEIARARKAAGQQMFGTDEIGNAAGGSEEDIRAMLRRARAGQPALTYGG